jgi:inhibitor of cysteine peptidase
MKTYNLSVNQQLVINLNENPTTGYRWHFRGVNTSLIDLVQDNYTLSTESKLGGGGVRSIKYKAKSEGKCDLTFKHIREWEGEGFAIETLEITLLIS